MKAFDEYIHVVPFIMSEAVHEQPSATIVDRDR